jgi:arabinofuranosyltransferase
MDFLFPNTAYAKMNTGIDRRDLISQGYNYLQSSFHLDTITMIILLGCLVWFLWRGPTREKMAMVGIILYVGYIVYIGGDFMAVRFFSVPIFICAALLTTIDYKSNLVYVVFLSTLVVIGLLNPRAPLRSQAGYVPQDSKMMIDENQVSDERLYYYHNYGWFSASRQKPLPGSVHAGRKWIYDPGKRKVVLVGPLGVRGYQAGPNIHMIDDNALADPLMSRLPVKDTRFWRIGHFDHIIPAGYLASLDSEKNKILDPDLAHYYDVLKQVVSGDLWDIGRLKEIIRLNWGYYDPLLDAYLENWYAQGKPMDSYK